MALEEIVCIEGARNVVYARPGELGTVEQAFPAPGLYPGDLMVRFDRTAGLSTLVVESEVTALESLS